MLWLIDRPGDAQIVDCKSNICLCYTLSLPHVHDFKHLGRHFLVTSLHISKPCKSLSELHADEPDCMLCLHLCIIETDQKRQQE